MPRTTITAAYNPLAREGPEADTGALALVLLEAATGERVFGALTSPYAGQFVPLVGRDLDAERGEFLEEAGLRATLGSPFELLLRDWVRDPPGYAEMRRQLANP